MSSLLGDFTCKLDEKGRVLLPSAYIKQMASSKQDRFVIKRDIFEPCLVLMPMDEWERRCEILKENTNPYNQEHNQFLRSFFRGTAEVVLDSNNRLLIPKRLLDEINAGREIVMSGHMDKIEIWPVESYNNINQDQIAKLAEKIMGNYRASDISGRNRKDE